MTNPFEPRPVHTQQRLDTGLGVRRDRADQLATVLRITHQISRIRTLELLLETFAHELHTALGYSSVDVLLLEGDTLVSQGSTLATSGRAVARRAVIGTSPAALACKHGCLIFSTDFSGEAKTTTYPDAQLPCVVAPLVANGRTIGALELRSTSAHRWGSADLEALMALAKQSAIIIENTRRHTIESEQLYAALQARADQLALVDEISRTISASLDQNDALQAIVTQVPRAVPCERLSLAAYDAERRVLTIRALWVAGQSTSIDVGSDVQLDETEAQHAVASGHLYYVSDLNSSEAAYSRRLVRDEHLGSVVHVPITSGDICLGVLSLARTYANAFDANDLALLNSLAPHLATAFKNASLYAQAQQAYAELAMAQEHTLQAERLRAIGELASGVAHDFNNLLSIILGHMEVMKTADPVVAERSRRAVIQAANDGAQTVRRIQNFVRAQPEQHSTPVSLHELADDVIHLTMPRWHSDMMNKGITIEVQRDLRQVPTVLGNSAELREVVTNLVLNAVDAMPQGGKLFVATGMDTTHAWIDIGDTGHGIPAEVQARIFEPFYTTKANRGTGLGLAVSRSIAKRHQGDLVVESTPGVGSRFRLLLPIASAHAASAADTVVVAPIAASATAPLRILLVEDDQAVRETLVQLLRLDAHQVDSVADGQAALAQFHPNTYDLVCSDLGLPNMTGWDVLREVRAIDPAIATMLMSGWGAQLDPQEARERHADVVVPKPIDIDLLNATLARVPRRSG